MVIGNDVAIGREYHSAAAADRFAFRFAIGIPVTSGGNLGLYIYAHNAAHATLHNARAAVALGAAVIRLNAAAGLRSRILRYGRGICRVVLLGRCSCIAEHLLLGGLIVSAYAAAYRQSGTSEQQRRHYHGNYHLCHRNKLFRFAAVSAAAVARAVGIVARVCISAVIILAVVRLALLRLFALLGVLLRVLLFIPFPVVFHIISSFRSRSRGNSWSFSFYGLIIPTDYVQ